MKMSEAIEGESAPSASFAPDLPSRFRRFALENALPTSPLYSQIALGIAGDPAALRLANRAASHPVTNLFLAAVHFLLLRGADHPLRNFYPNLTDEISRTEQVYSEFQSFCGLYQDEIVHLLRTRRTQTNEVCRCLYVALGLDRVVREAGELAVIDVGASAGLHLLWPRYGYDYDGRKLGDASAPVQLSCRFRGRVRPIMPGEWAKPLIQIGIDLNPLDARNSDDCLWLQALVWPENRERARWLDAALGMARQTPPLLLRGDAFDLLPRVLSSLDQDIAVCVCHNHTLNQFSSPERARFFNLLADFGKQRNIYELSAEWIDRSGMNTQQPGFVLSHYFRGSRSDRLLAYVDDHGQWIEWVGTG